MNAAQPRDVRWSPFRLFGRSQVLLSLLLVIYCWLLLEPLSSGISDLHWAQSYDFEPMDQTLQRVAAKAQPSSGNSYVARHMPAVDARSYGRGVTIGVHSERFSDRTGNSPAWAACDVIMVTSPFRCSELFRWATSRNSPPPVALLEPECIRHLRLPPAPNILRLVTGGVAVVPALMPFRGAGADSQLLCFSQDEEVATNAANVAGAGVTRTVVLLRSRITLAATYVGRLFWEKWSAHVHEVSPLRALVRLESEVEPVSLDLDEVALCSRPTGATGQVLIIAACGSSAHFAVEWTHNSGEFRVGLVCVSSYNNAIVEVVAQGSDVVLHSL